MRRFNRPVLIMGLAASLVATALPAPLVAQAPPPMQAGASQAGAALDVGVFYDQLADYGTWVAHPDYDYVFIPADTGPGWRPYQDGRWVWTDAYGWYWESDEPFGWATYHYGRWGYDPAYGWFWVPGDTWAPAWVVWRRGDGRTGWAPIGPDRPGLAVGQPAAYVPPVAESWVFVEDRYMGADDLAPYVAPIAAIGSFLRAAPQFYEPSWTDGYYVNRGFDVNVFAPSVRTRIVTREVVYVDRRDDRFYADNRLGIYAPRISFGQRPAAPPRLQQEIAADRRAMLRQYVRNGRDLPGAFTPSAALLGALEPEQRRELRERRFRDPDGYRRDVGRIEQERAERIRELRREADTRADSVERERREAIQQRRQSVERLRAEQRERAQRVTTRPDGGPRPGVSPGVRPDVPQAQRPQQVEERRRQAEQQRAERQRAAEQQRDQAQDARRQEMEQRRNVQRQQSEETRRAAEQQRNAQRARRQQEAEQRRTQQRTQRQQEAQQRRSQQQQEAKQPPAQRQQEVQQRRLQRHEEIQRRRQSQPQPPNGG